MELTAFIYNLAVKVEEMRGGEAGAICRALGPPGMASGFWPRFMIANVGANGWADNLKCAIDLFLLALLDRCAPIAFFPLRYLMPNRLQIKPLSM